MTAHVHQAVANLVDAIGHHQFLSELASVGESIMGFDSTLISAFLSREKPQLLYSNLKTSDEKPTLAPYFDGAYLLDPLYCLYRESASDGVYPLSDIAPGDFFSSEYYLNYYQQTGIVSETGVIINVHKDIAIAISYGIRSEFIDQNNIQIFQTFFPIIKAACKQHWQQESQLAPLLQTIHMGGEFGSTLDRAFRNFGSEYLTPRECEIVHLILKGYASKAISELLGISLETVKVHRKRFHAKLDISSQSELFSLFIDAISLVPLNLNDEDPLSFYYQNSEQE